MRSTNTYVTNEISGTLTVINVAQRKVAGSILLEEGQGKPVGVIVSPDGRFIYVSNGRGKR